MPISGGEHWWLMDELKSSMQNNGIQGNVKHSRAQIIHAHIGLGSASLGMCNE